MTIKKHKNMFLKIYKKNIKTVFNIYASGCTVLSP